jgi:hypothetical protein
MSQFGGGGGAPPTPWYKENPFWGSVGGFSTFALAGIGFGLSGHLTLGRSLFAVAWPWGVTAIWLAVNGLTSKKWIRISSRVAAIVIVGVILTLGGSWMAKANTPVATAVPPAPIQQPSPMPQEKPVKQQSALALHVTGYTLYQQTVGEPLRLGIHVANDGSTTIKSSGASAVGVFESNGNAPQPELEEKVFRVAKRKFEELKNTGKLSLVEIPPQSKMHFDIDSRPKVLTSEMLTSITTGSIRVYFAGIIQYMDTEGQQSIPYCGFTDASIHSVPNCEKHNAPYAAARAVQ